MIELGRRLRALARPIVWLPPLAVLVSAITFGKLFGCVGILMALPVGIALGVGMVWFWYAYIEADAGERDEAFRERIVRELGDARRLRGTPGHAVGPIALEGTSSSPGPAAPLAPGRESLESIEARAQGDPAGALAELETLSRAQPRNAPLAALEARTLLAAGRVSDACRAAGEAVQIAALVGDLETATDTMVALWSKRDDVSIEAATALELGRAFVERADFRRGAWCADRARVLGGDSSRARALIVTAARGSEEAGESALAARLYDHALDIDPSARDAAELRDRLARLGERERE